MKKKIEQVTIAEEIVISKIYLIRGRKVMIDRQIAGARIVVLVALLSSCFFLA